VRIRCVYQHLRVIVVALRVVQQGRHATAKGGRTGWILKIGKGTTTRNAIELFISQFMWEDHKILHPKVAAPSLSDISRLFQDRFIQLAK
jgi:hypothetical protein